jgi:hypothetical protein
VERGISWKVRVWDLLEDEMAPKRGMAERSDNGFCIIYIALSGLVLEADFFTFLCNRLRFKILISQCFARLFFLRFLLYRSYNTTVSVYVLQVNRNIS